MQETFSELIKVLIKDTDQKKIILLLLFCSVKPRFIWFIDLLIDLQFWFYCSEVQCYPISCF